MQREVKIWKNKAKIAERSLQEYKGEGDQDLTKKSLRKAKSLMSAGTQPAPNPLGLAMASQMESLLKKVQETTEKQLRRGSARPRDPTPPNRDLGVVNPQIQVL